MLADQIALEPREISPSLLARTLAPYKPTETDYLREARLVQQCDLSEESPDDTPIATVAGKFRIPNSCYIQSTGHFNAVEYLICFNQLAYTAIGQLISENVLATLPASRISEECREELQKLTIARFFDKQLSSMLILNTETRFNRMINAQDFSGEWRLKSLVFRKNLLFAQTSCAFSDACGGSADGNVLLAYALNIA